MKSSGGMVGETATLLSSLCGIIDRHKGLLLGCTWQECQIRLAIDLYRGLHGACSKQLTKEVHDGALQGASAAFPYDMHLIPLNIRDFLYRYSQRRQLLHSIFFVPGLAIDFPSNIWPVWYSQLPELIYIYINFLSLHEFYHILPSNRGNLGVKLGWGFLLEPRPLKPPCLAERSWVMGGTGVLCPESWFVLFIYSLIFFWIRFFSSLNDFFLINLQNIFLIYFFKSIYCKPN